MSKTKRKYYRYLGWCDGSGCPYGIVIKCYTDKQHEQFKNIYRLVEMKGEDNGKTEIQSEQ